MGCREGWEEGDRLGWPVGKVEEGRRDGSYVGFTEVNSEGYIVGSSVG